jgi:hypothetical protein
MDQSLSEVYGLQSSEVQVQIMESVWLGLTAKEASGLTLFTSDPHLRARPSTSILILCV